jgi:hypothetical protein
MYFQRAKIRTAQTALSGRVPAICQHCSHCVLLLLHGQWQGQAVRTIRSAGLAHAYNVHLPLTPPSEFLRASLQILPHAISCTPFFGRRAALVHCEVLILESGTKMLTAFFWFKFLCFHDRKKSTAVQIQLYPGCLPPEPPPSFFFRLITHPSQPLRPPKTATPSSPPSLP